MRRLLLLLCACVLTTIALADAGGYYYRDWDVVVRISADNTWTVDEFYSVTFTEPRHGIYRYIQNEIGASRNLNPDGETPDVQYRIYRPEIKIVAAGDDDCCEMEDENDCTTLRWGDADRWVEGDRDYWLSYTYKTPDDRVPARDYLFHSLLPSDVNVPIGAFFFELHFDKPLPKDIASRVKVYTGPFGQQQEAKIDKYFVSDTLIYGTIFNVAPRNAVTIYAELPEGYYENTSKTPTWPFYGLFGLSLALMAVLYMRQQNNQTPVTKVVSFYAPEGITPAEVGKIIDDSTDNIDIAALIPYLAQEGYIAIEEYEKKGFLSKKTDLKLRKLKDVPEYGGSNILARMMELLFDGSDVVHMSELGDRHAEYERTKAAVDATFRHDRKLIETHDVMYYLLLIACSSLMVAVSSPVKLFYLPAVMAAAVWGGSSLFAYILRSTFASRDLFTSKWNRFCEIGFRVIAFGVVMFGVMQILNQHNESFLSATTQIAVGALMFFVLERSGRSRVNTKFRAEMAGQLLGFREFIETAEKDRLKMLQDQDPAYFYKVLPYAMIFGLSDKWADLFKDMNVEPASWYNSSAPFYSTSYIHGLTSSMTNNVYSSIKTSAVDHTASSSSGGSFSGGGFSGGGGGGGGAGSW